jgi:hypothetical protein
LQWIADDTAALAERIAALEETVATLRCAPPADPKASAVTASVEPAAPMMSGVKWPHMADNIFLGLVTLIAAHWLANSVGDRPVFRLVALVVALPFGYRFERNSRSGASVLVIAAIAYGSLGTMALGLLDMAVGNITPRSLSAPDIVASVAAIGLSHFAGSALAQTRQRRADRAAGVVVVHRLPHLEVTRIKSTADTVKALYEAIAPIAAGAAAIWATFHHFLY